MDDLFPPTRKRRDGRVFVTAQQARRKRIVIRPRYAAAVLIVFNPMAGAGRRRRLARALGALRALGLRPDLAETSGPGDATLLARAAAAEGRRLVVAAGGDGTIAEVAAGISGSGTGLGLLPLGTANVLAWELGVPRRPEAAAAVLAGGRDTVLWPGLASFPDGRERLFVQMLGAGFDAAVVTNLDLRLKQRIGRAAYVLQSLRELPRHAFPPITVELDGRCLTVASAIVSKGRLYAGRHLIAPQADPAAPGFRVVLFTRSGAAQVVLAGLALPLGLIPRLPGVEIRPAHGLRLASGSGVPVQTDGDPAGLLPVSVRDAPAPLRIRLP